MSGCGRKQFASGVVCVFTDEAETAAFVDTLAAETSTKAFSFALVFFSKATWPAEAVVETMKAAAPALAYAACSTAGEITPSGLAEGEIVVILFPADTFSVASRYIRDISHQGIETVSLEIATCRRELVASLDPARTGSVFALCLIDGMSYAEEAFTAAVHWGLDDIPLLGGSAGDNMNFTDTCLICDGVISSGAAIVLLVHSVVPFHVFKTENFVPTKVKLVVTKSDPDRRVVHELNAMPAAVEYANVIGTDASALAPQSFASHPLVVRVGGEYYCRSIQKVNEDNSLSFFCAIDDGIVLTVAEPQGMARTTEAAFDEVRETIGDIDFVIGFDCVLRQIDARNRQVTHKISEIYRNNHVVGFNTYGEQYRSMHLNQTFTGIAFGQPVAGSSVQ